MSVLRKVSVAVAIPLLFLFQAWRIYQNHFWRSGINHYEKGGGVLLASGYNKAEMKSAQEAFRRARIINPLRGKFWNHEGHALRYQGDLETAILRYESGKRALGDDLVSHYHIALCHMKLGNRDEMIDALRSAVALRPKLNSEVRFREDFAHLISDEDMKEFRN